MSDDNVIQYNIIREQGEFFDIVPLTDDENEIVTTQETEE